jgi:quinoprotein relay system zinc metallohydrolase 2
VVNSLIPQNRSLSPVLSRAEFLKGVAAVAVTPFVGTLSAKAAQFGLTEIANGIFVHQGIHAVQSDANKGDIANASFVIGRDAVGVIDTSGSAKMGADLLTAIRAMTDKPIRYVINTHMHPDHVLGNKPFKSDATTFVAHHKMGRSLAARAQSYMASNQRMIGAAAFEGTEIVLPNLAVADRMELDLGGRILVCEVQPTAHTDNDLTVTDTATGTLFLGDLLFSEHLPTIDGSIKGWLALMPRLASTARVARVVPGHGPPSMAWPGAVRPMMAYLDALVNDVRSLIERGASLNEAIAVAGVTEKARWLLFEDYHARNVTTAFAELEWE